LALALEKFGTKPLKEVLAPAIQIAKDGFPLDTYTASYIADEYSRLEDFPATLEILAPRGRMPQVGDRLVMKEMAETMRLMAEEGVESFYKGPIADKMVAHIREHGGILSQEDLSSYRARVEEEPSRGEYRGYEIYTPSLYSGGGATILQILNLLEGFDVARMGAGSPQLVHLVVEATKLAWRDRLTFMGDPAYMRIPEEEFISKAYADRQRAELRRILEAGFISPSGAGRVSGPGHTTHMNVMDEQGNMVALTQTDGWVFGSLVTIPGLGFNINNGMSSFDPRPGRVNSIAPRKRPISRMCPTIVLKDGQPVIALGAGGGRKIVNVLAQMLVDLIDFGMTAEEAIRAPRFHCEQEEPILFEHGEDMAWGFSSEVIEALRGMGHVLRFTGEEPNPRDWRVAWQYVITCDPTTGERRGAVRRVPVIEGAVAGY
jgi:gamma-glutamyltranspeptidase/glutathione hydrolase